MASSLYRKYRPRKFSELIGQEHVAKALQNALSEDRLAHAYLFSGTRGTGKTSTARILGAVLNCEKFKDGYSKKPIEIEPCGECESCVSSRAGKSFDVIELDAASNNGVDDMRELIEKVSYSSAAGGTKVYIIDEVHELTGRAANALLKTLEEPPAHVVFILATTNPEKVLPTIRSRTQHFEFQVVSENRLFEFGKEVLSWEEKELDDDTLQFVARKGAGSVRDMLSFLDQVLALEVTSLEELEDAHGSNDSPKVLELMLAASSGDVGESLSCLHEIAQSGKEPRAIVENIISIARDCLVVSLNPTATILLSNVADRDELKNVGDKCGISFLRQFILKLGKAVADMRGTATLSPLLNVEVALLSSIGGSEYQCEPQREQSASKSEIEPAPRPKFEMPKRSTTMETESVQQDAKKGNATLGSLKKEVSVSDASSGKSKEVQAPTATKLNVRDVNASWSKVVDLLSVASQGAIKKAQPVRLEGDVLTFGVLPDELEEVKARFKKDAAIIRGFLESLHEVSFRFQIIGDENISTLDSEEKQNGSKIDGDSIEKTIAESKEFDPVDTVVSIFGGEVVPGN